MEMLEISEGNTSSSEITVKKRIVPGKRWCFTAYDEAETLLTKIKSDTGCKYVAGWETCPSTERLHLQGYIEHEKKIRPIEKYGTKDTHWEKAKGTKDENIEYCTKDGNYETNFKIRKPVLDPMNGKTFKDWQLKICDIIVNPVDERKIFWFWETQGGCGKSTFCKHLCMKYDAMLVGGKGNDIKYAVYNWLEEKDLDILIWDIPRNVGNTISYSSVEEIKNGCMFNNKYESGMKVFNSPHVIIFANEPPVEDKLSKDRWVIHEIQ